MAAAKKKNKDDDFTYKELMEYERLIGEPLDEINNDEKPRLAKIATLGWLRAKRVNDVSFDDYVENTDADQIVIDAFGEQTEEKKEKTTSEKPEQ